MGRTSTPAWCMLITKYDSPPCLTASQSVRAIKIPMSAWSALVFQTFWPFTIHSSPSCSALVFNPARSEPATGSENSWHHANSPVRVRRRNFLFSSSEPWSYMVGAANPMPPPSGTETPPALRMVWWATRSAHTGRSRPNQSDDHDGTAQPESTSRPRHSIKDRSGSHDSWNHSSTWVAISASVSASFVAI